MAEATAPRKRAVRKAPATQPARKAAKRKPATPAYPARRPIEAGDRGSAVLAVQERLSALGHYGGKVNGVFGYMTTKAVRRLQADKGMRPSGVVDAATWAALYN